MSAYILFSIKKEKMTCRILLSEFNKNSALS